MAANLRRGNLPTETTMARFMYYIIKQLDVRGVSNLLPYLLLVLLNPNLYRTIIRLDLHHTSSFLVYLCSHLYL